jgi:hypothetical protein
MSHEAENPLDDEDDNLIPVNSREEIPPFATDEEAAAFWETHSVGPGLAKLARRPGSPWAARELRRRERTQRETSKRPN